MANPEHIDKLNEGVQIWNQWRIDNPKVRPDISEAKLLKRDLRGANLRQVDFYKSDLSGSDLSGTDLSEAFLSHVTLDDANISHTKLYKAILVESSLKGTDLRGARIYGASVWNVKLDRESKQDGLIITWPDEAIITVDDIEIAQFIYLLLNREKLRNAINGVTRKGVLLLGRFGGGGLEVLEAIAAKLRELGYLPIIFDFERPRDQDYTETIQTLVGLVRFVIVDLSGPSVPHELMTTVPDFEKPFVPILEEGKEPHSMFMDLTKYPWVHMPILYFENVTALLEKMPSEIIEPAEAIIERKQNRLNQY